MIIMFNDLVFVKVDGRYVVGKPALRLMKDQSGVLTDKVKLLHTQLYPSMNKAILGAAKMHLRQKYHQGEIKTLDESLDEYDRVTAELKRLVNRYKK